jgi:hypothetical protein
LAETRTLRFAAVQDRRLPRSWSAARYQTRLQRIPQAILTAEALPILKPHLALAKDLDRAITSGERANRRRRHSRVFAARGGLKDER